MKLAVKLNIFNVNIIARNKKNTNYLNYQYSHAQYTIKKITIHNFQ